MKSLSVVMRLAKPHMTDMVERATAFSGNLSYGIKNWNKNLYVWDAQCFSYWEIIHRHGMRLKVRKMSGNGLPAEFLALFLTFLI